jgi:hypothetical protein
MLSCQQASELMSQKLDRPLKINEKLRLQMHLMICKSCPKLLQQFEILQEAGKKYTEHYANQHDNELKMDVEVKQRILKTLEQKTNDSEDQQGN